MKMLLPLTVLVSVIIATSSKAQNVFDPLDSIVRYDSNMPLGSLQNPNPAKTGLQKWVSRPSNGISAGSTQWDASSFKAYFINANGRKVVFRLKYPKSFIDSAGTGKKYPVMLFLHGAGENGCPENGGIYNNEKHLGNGGKLFRDRVDQGKFDGFLLYPQKQQPVECWGSWSLNTSEFSPMINILDSLAKYANLDVDRVLVTGLSAGGSAAFYFASSFATRIAKVAPSAAASGFGNNTSFYHIPIWFATGGKDAAPTATSAKNYYNKYKKLGLDIKFTLFSDAGHAMWTNHWTDAAFIPFMNDMHKANPLVYFQRYEFCKDSAVLATLGLTAGYYAYEWQKDGVTIATRTNGTNTILDPGSVVSYTGNEVVINSYGTFRARFKRTANAEWSAWSPNPAVIKEKNLTQTPAIQITGTRSRIVPAPDGSTKVPLELPEGYVKYEWYRVSDNAIVATTSNYTAEPGQYKAKYYEEFGCGSNFSPIFKVIDANGSPSPLAPTSLTAEAISSTSIRLRWVDNAAAPASETGYEIYRGTSPGGPYELVTTTKANAVTHENKSLSATQRYYYVIRAISETGASAISNEASAGNNPPSISNIGTVRVSTGGSTDVDFTVTDPEEPLTVSIVGQLNFLSLTNTGTNNYRITINPTVNHIGWYNVEVSAKDSKGAISSKAFTLVVSDNNVRSVYLNLGNSSRPAPAPWTNWLGKRSANNVINNLKDVNGVATTFSVTTLQTWSTITDLGHITGNNSGVFPDTVLQSGIADTASLKTLRIGGLDPSLRYNLTFVGSQNEGDNAASEYRSGDQKDVLTARYNTRLTANLNKLAPNAEGQILVEIRRVNPNTFNYLNAMLIEEFNPSALLGPVNLFAEPIDRTSILATWTDRAGSENSTDGYQLQYAMDSLFTNNLKTITLNSNTTSYKATGLSINRRYYFRVRTKEGSLLSEFSNRATAITPNYMVYVNFNYTVANASSPWNNLVASPTSEQTITGLLKQDGISSGINLSIERPFNGEFNAGMNTTNNSGIVPDRVLQSNFWLDKTQISQIKLSKISRTQRYRIGFIGSSGPLGWFKGNYTASYSIGSRTVYLNSWMNTNGIVWIGDIVPDGGSNIVIRFSTTEAAMYGFNGGMIIMAYSDAQGGSMPNEVNPENEVALADVAAQVDSVYLEPKVFPNPFSDFFNIQLHNPTNNANFTADILDMSGKLLARRQFNSRPTGNVILRMEQLGLKTQDRALMVNIKLNGKLYKTVRILHYKK